MADIDIQSPETPSFMRPEDFHVPAAPGSSPSSGSSGGAYPVYVCISMPTVDSPLTFKQGNVGMTLVMMLTHLNGAPMDLTGKLVTLKMQPISGGTLKINALVVILLAAYGIVSYAFVGTDTDTPALYNLEFVTTNADGSAGVETFPGDSYLSVNILPSEG
jgi:hypothetical protein